jgi:DNA invertase Pin-like site-specific DNA recombinase
MAPATRRNVIVQRTKAGLAAARARGRKGGRPAGLTLKFQRVAPAVRHLYEASKKSTAQIMKYFGIGSRRTLYKILRVYQFLSKTANGPP